VSVNETHHPRFPGAPGIRCIQSRLPLAEPLALPISAIAEPEADSDALVFVSPEGGPLRYANWRNRVWSPAREAAGLPNLGFHDLRRAHGDGARGGSTDMKTTQVRMGHSDSRLTLALYAQAVPEADQAAADRLSGRFIPGSRDERAMGGKAAKSSR